MYSLEQINNPETEKSVETILRIFDLIRPFQPDNDFERTPLKQATLSSIVTTPCSDVVNSKKVDLSISNDPLIYTSLHYIYI